MAAQTHAVRIDRRKSLRDEPHTGHNRWHPDIPPVLRVDPGDTVVLETRDALDGAVTPDSTGADLGRVDLNLVHPLTGPVFVNGAEPGDLLEVQILDIAPQPFGFTTIVPGFGFLRDFFPSPFLVKWTIAGGFAVSPDLPGVRIPGGPFMGVMGVAPSHELLAHLTARENELLRRGGAVLPPSSQGAVPAVEPIASESLRTIPPRETGGNFDIKQLTAGTTLLLPICVPGALFSAGDSHFAQGDGESCGTAVEMGATLTVRFGLRKGVAAQRRIQRPQYERGDYFIDPRFAVPRRFFATTGMPITRDGRNESENVTLAAQDALLNMIDYLMAERGYSREQAYVLTSVAVDLRISELVDVPNVVVSAFLPLEIFEEGVGS
ncbi:MAG TPA: acetamidase/formamidase family protein [Alphaproteobacteria bacterium]|nr:acetamidase/formamidase family protein [Alphaproteobacteria bacterium]